MYLLPTEKCQVLVFLDGSAGKDLRLRLSIDKMREMCQKKGLHFGADPCWMARA